MILALVLVVRFVLTGGLTMLKIWRRRGAGQQPGRSRDRVRPRVLHHDDKCRHHGPRGSEPGDPVCLGRPVEGLAQHVGRKAVVARCSASSDRIWS